MVGVTVVGSGSRGNSMVVDFGDVRVAVDAGFGPRSMVKRLRGAGVEPTSIDVCAITHEHVDHAQGAAAMRDKWRWTLAATRPTLAAVGVANATAHVAPLAYDETATFGDVRITLIEVAHDASAPAAVVIEHVPSGARVGVAHDLGVVPERLVAAFERLDLLVVEANHDVGMLRAGPYPPFLQDRISGGRGHLNNSQTAALVARVVHPGLRAVVLAHLSEKNNTPELARLAVGEVLRGARYRGTLSVAAQDVVTSAGARRTSQLSLL